MAGYRWARLDVDYFRHPRAIAAGRDGRAVHIASILWAVEQGTNGYLESGDGIARIIKEAGTTRRSIELVVESGLWVPNGHGYEIHDFLDRNKSRAQRDEDRDKWSARQQRKRQRDRQEGDE